MKMAAERSPKGDVLLISYDYLPVVTPNSFRWSSIAEYWSRQGTCVWVLCAWQPGLARKETLNGVHVYRVGGRITQKIRLGLMKRYRSLALNRLDGRERLTAKGRALGSIKWLHDHTWKYLYWPDYACFWLFLARRAAERLITGHHIENMITVSYPFSAHLAGEAVEKRHPGTAWIADIIDPSFFPESPSTNNRWLYARLNRRAEGRIFHRARAISVLTESIRGVFGELYPDCISKIHVNPNLLHIRPGMKRTGHPEEEKIRLVFVGTLNRSVRSPGHTLRVFERLRQTRIGEKLELHLIGRIEYCDELFEPYRDFVNRVIFCPGPVDRDTALETMAGADILVNIGNANPYQEPSKAIEYASTGRPIINIRAIPNDSSARVLEKYPAVLNIPGWIQEPTVEDVDRWVQFIENPPMVERDVVETIVKPYLVDRIAQAYAAMLTEA